MRQQCKKCEFFHCRQGKGKAGDCYRYPVTTEKHEGNRACGEFTVNLEKYHINGKKIYTRIDTKNYKPGETYNDSITFNMNDTGSGIGR